MVPMSQEHALSFNAGMDTKHKDIVVHIVMDTLGNGMLMVAIFSHVQVMIHLYQIYLEEE